MRRYLQLWRAVFLIIRLLFLTDSAEVPEDDTPVITSAAENTGLVGVPRERSGRILVAFESMDLLLDITQVPDADRVVRGGGRDQDLGRRVKC